MCSGVNEGMVFDGSYANFVYSAATFVGNIPREKGGIKGLKTSFDVRRGVIKGSRKRMGSDQTQARKRVRCAFFSLRQGKGDVS